MKIVVGKDGTLTVPAIKLKKSDDTTVTLTAEILEQIINFSNQSGIVQLTIDSPTTAPGNLAFPVSFDFDKPVVGFKEEDVTVSGGALSDFTKASEVKYTATLTPVNADGTLTLSVQEGTFYGVSGEVGMAAEKSTTINFVVITYTFIPYSEFTIGASSTNNSAVGVARLVDGNKYTEWISGQDQVAATLTMDFGSGNTKQVTRLRVRGNKNNKPSCPKDWTFEGSNDNSSWDVLDTVTESTGWVGDEEVRAFVLASTGQYRYYRMVITANNGNAGYTSFNDIFLDVSP